MLRIGIFLGKPRLSPRARKVCTAAAIFLFFVLLFATVFAHALCRKLDHDEEQFVAAGALLLRDGLLPFRDYPFFHLPNLPIIYARLFSTNDYLLLTARSFNAACAALLLALIFSTAARRFRGVHPSHLGIAAASAAILSLDPFFRFTMGRAWNHDLPVLATMTALLGLLRSVESKRAAQWIFFSGAMLGLAMGSRLTFAPMPVAFLAILIVLPSRNLSRLKGVCLFFGGLILALGPTIALWIMAPKQFVFGNFTYNGPLNDFFRRSTSPDKITFTHKSLFIVKELAKSPSTLALLAGFFYFGGRQLFRSGWRQIVAHPEIVSICLILPFLFIGVWVPTPGHRQYFYAVVPFLLLGNIYSLARETILNRTVTLLVTALLVLSIARSAESFLQEKFVFRPSRWGAIAAHIRGAQIRQLVSNGPVFTLDPLCPLEGGLTIYKELAVGPFAWRTAAFLNEDEETDFDILDPDDLETFVRLHPPAAFLTRNRSDDVGYILLRYLQTHAYTAHRLDDGATLWLAVDSAGVAARN